METRMKRLREKMTEYSLDYLLVTDKVNRRYLTGFTGSNGLLLIGKNSNHLIVDGRYTEQAQQQTSNTTILTTSSSKNQWVYASELINGGSVGFEAETIPYQVFKDLKSLTKEMDIRLVETNHLIEKLRLIKSEQELFCLRKAAQLADQAFSYITTIIKPGMSELDVANEIDYYSKRIGSEGPAFETIVASGKRTALPHAHASKKIIQKNELIMIDFGCIFGGYYSDITRTFALGEVNEVIKKAYDQVLFAQKQAIEAITIGGKLKDIDKAARDCLKKELLDRYFSHGLGHGIGLSCHEYPGVDRTSEERIIEGMTFTVEPGVYLAGDFGIRIEDDVYINSEGKAECLTQTKKEWMVIG
ncbi:M24 family metallopeptidase [Enterococcus larvae]|uniref:M24 family metallopeptidase n=1 Tax=Enterococcus larvae TaxID=2794352 RepID=UPI003F41628D